MARPHMSRVTPARVSAVWAIWAANTGTITSATAADRAARTKRPRAPSRRRVARRGAVRGRSGRRWWWRASAGHRARVAVQAWDARAGADAVAAVAGRVEHPAGRGRLGLRRRAGPRALGEIRTEQRERGALPDALGDLPQRLGLAELRRPRQPVVARHAAAVELGGCGHQRLRCAERDQRRPVA